jgi:hypothetical protein
VGCLDHITDRSRTALEYELILRVWTTHTSFGCGVKRLSEDINYLLSVVREMLLNTIQNVDFIAVRLLLG